MVPSQIFPLLAALLQLRQAVAIPFHGKRQASAVPSYVLDYGKHLSTSIILIAPYCD